MMHASFYFDCIILEGAGVYLLKLEMRFLAGVQASTPPRVMLCQALGSRSSTGSPEVCSAKLLASLFP